MLRDLILRPKADPLNAGTIPGTRKVNNLPVVIVGAVVLIFVAIVGFIMMMRAEQAAVREKEPKTASGSTQFATDYTAEWANGVVPPVDVPPPPSDSELPELPAVPGAARSATAAQQVTSPPPDVWSEARIRFQNGRMQAFEAALKSRTGVQVAKSTGRTPTAEGVRNEIDATRRQIAAMGSDPMAAYQARMASLSSQGAQQGASGVSPALLGASSPANGEGQRSGQYARDNWTLENSVAIPAPYTLQAGFVLPAVMISGIVSNLPGQVMAQVSQHVYDTPTGRHLLIPQGTRLIGTYNSDIGYGQERVLMAWQRLIFPDGRTLNIQAMPGADMAGNAGFTDQVDNHYFRTFASAFLLSGIIAAVSMSQDSDRDTNERSNQQRASDSLSEALGQNLGSAMTEMLRKNMNIAPTLQIRPGYRFNVMVTKDMVFEGPYGPKQ